MLDGPGSDGVEHHIAAHFLKMAVFLHEYPFKSSLKERPHPMMTPIRGLGRDPVYLARFL
jgi:hypothetical protein